MLSADVIGRGAEALVNTGDVLVTMGRTDKGIALMEQGVSTGGLTQKSASSATQALTPMRVAAYLLSPYFVTSE